MFGFGKRKENSEFKLDEEQLPSLSDQNSDPVSSPEMPVSTSPVGEDPSLQFPSSSSPFPQSPEPQATPVSQDLGSVHQDITKAKLESVEAKLSLSEARLSSIEQKLELLTRVIMEEVSDETKQKLKLDKMKSSFK